MGKGDRGSCSLVLISGLCLPAITIKGRDRGSWSLVLILGLVLARDDNQWEGDRGSCSLVLILGLELARDDNNGC